MHDEKVVGGKVKTAPTTGDSADKGPRGAMRVTHRGRMPEPQKIMFPRIAAEAKGIRPNPQEDIQGQRSAQMDGFHVQPNRMVQNFDGKARRVHWLGAAKHAGEYTKDV